MLDHDPHSYEQLAHAFEGHPEGGLTRDAILDNITLYWVTNTGTSAARLYWERTCRLLGASLGSYGIHEQSLPRQNGTKSRRSPAASQVDAEPRGSSPASSGARRGPGWIEPTRISSTSTKSISADTSQRGNSRSFSPPKCARRSDRYAKRAIERRRAGTARRRQTVGALENCHEFRDTQLKWQGSVLLVEIAAPPMNLLGRELLRDLVSLIQQAEADDPIRVLVFKSADPDYFISRVDVTNPLEPSCTTGL